MAWSTVFMLISLAMTIASTIYQLTQSKKKTPQQNNDAADARKGYELVTEGNPDNISLAYGRVKIGGVRVYHNTSSDFNYVATNADKAFYTGLSQTRSGFYSMLVNDVTGVASLVKTNYAYTQSTLLDHSFTDGSRNEFLYFQQAICRGPINDILDVIIDESRYLDDPALGTYGSVPSSNYFTEENSPEKTKWDDPNKPRSALRIDTHFNATGIGKADSLISANFPDRSTATFDGMAYASAVFRIDRDDPQFTSVPTLQFLIEGKLIRKVVSGILNTTWEYSNNPSWCLLDYLLDSVAGAGVDTSEIDFSSFEAAAVVCNRVVQKNVVVGGKIWKPTDGSINAPATTLNGNVVRDLPLYECNIIIDPKKTIRDNIETLLGTMADARLIWSGGKYKLSLQYPIVSFDANGLPIVGNSGIVSAGTITDDNLVLDQDFEITWPSASERLNNCTIRFQNECENFKEDSVSWPPKVSATYLRGVGGIKYPLADYSYDENYTGGRFLNNYGVWSGTTNTTTLTYNFIVRKADVGAMTLEYCADNSMTLTLYSGATVLGTYTNTNWQVLSSSTITLGNALADTVYKIVITATNTSLEKAAGARLLFGTKIIWSTRETAYSSIATITTDATVYNKMLLEDASIPLESEMFSDGISDYYHALAKAEELVRTSRSAYTLKFKYILNEKYYEPGDFVIVNSTTLAISNTYFRINSVKVGEDNTCEVVAQRFDYTQLAWAQKIDQYIQPNNLYNTSIPSPSQLVFTPESNALADTSGTLDWTAVSFSELAGYILYMHAAGDPKTIDGLPIFNEIGRATDTTFVLPKLDVTSAFFGVKAFSRSGRTSNFTYTSTVEAEFFNPNTYKFENLVLTPNGTTKVIAWNAFSVYKNNTLLTTVTASSATWTTGILYVYFDIKSTDATLHTVKTSINIDDIKNNKLITAYTGTGTAALQASDLQPPTNLKVEGRTDTFFNTRDVTLTWTNPAINSVKNASISKYVLQIFNFGTTTLKATYNITPNFDLGGTFKLSYEENVAIFGTATRKFDVKVFVLDSAGYLSLTSTNATIENTAPVATTFTVSGLMGVTALKATFVTDTDIVKYQFNQYTAATGGTPTSIITTNNYVDFEATAGTTYYYTVIVHDHYGAGIESSPRQAATSTTAEVNQWNLTGISFTANTPTANSVYWTGGSIIKNGTTTYTISANTAGVAYTTAKIYVYFDPTISTTALQTTTTLSTAIGANKWILASYSGGAAYTGLKGGDGSAFFSGSQLIAGSVGAGQLVTGTAVITEMAQIDNILQSSNYSTTGTYAGWRLDKTGTLYANGIDIRNANGTAIFQTGTGFNWNNVTGTNIPAPNADVTLNQLSGNGINICNPRYCTFEEATLPPVSGVANSGTIILDTAQKFFGTKSVKMTCATLEAYTYLGATNADHNITLQPNKKWIISGYIYSATAGTSCDIYIKTPVAHYPASGITVANTWTRISGVIDLTTDASTQAIMRIDVNTAGGIVWFDGLMVEQQIGTLTTPSAFNVPPNFLEKFVGALDATKNAIYRQTTTPTGGTYTTGDLWYNTTVGTGSLNQWDGSAWVKVSDITVDQVAGSGVNAMSPRHCTFEEATLPPFSSGATVTLSQDTAIKYFGTKSMKFATTSVASSFISTTDYPVIIPPNKKWIFSYYVYSDTATAAAVWNVSGVFGGLYDGASLYPSVYNATALTAATWTRLWGILDLSASALTSFKLRFDNHALNKNFWIDGVMLEEQVGNATTPSAFTIPPNFRDTYTGALDANNTYVDANGAIQGVSANAGTVVNNALVKVGGTNLMRNSGQFDSLDSWTTNGSTLTLDYATLYAGYPTIKLVGAGGILNSNVMRLKADTEYTVSALVKGSAASAANNYDTPLHIQVWRDEDTANLHQETGLVAENTISTSWKMVYQTFKTPVSAGACYCRFYFYYPAVFVAGYVFNVATVKLEEGNKYSAWTPAIEEVQNSEIRFNPNLVRSVDTWTLNSVTIEQNVYAANKQALLLAAGAGTISATSETLNLATSADYVVSFECWTTVAGGTLQVDLYPDTLPQYAVTPTIVPTLYTFVFNSADVNMASCSMRFFAQAGQHASGDIRVCDVKIERSSTRTPWLPHVLDQKWTNIGDRPTTLAGINSAEGTKLTGIEAGATVGATIGDYVQNSSALTLAGNATIASNAASKTTSYTAGTLTLAGDATVAGTTVSKGVDYVYNIYKVAGANAWDTQAYSSQSFTNNCYIEYQVDAIAQDIMVSLNTDPALDATYTGLDYAFHVNSANNVYAYESSVGTQIAGAYGMLDTFRVEYVGSNITYRRNNQIVRSVGTTAGRTFFLDISLATPNTTVKNLRMGTFTDRTFTAGTLTLAGNATINANSTSKPGATAAWDTQAYSTQYYQGGCAVRASVSAAATDAAFGLNSDPLTDASHTSIDYEVIFQAANTFVLYESNVSTGVTGTYLPSDVFEVEYTNCVVIYRKNGVVIRCVNTIVGRNFWFDSSIYTSGRGLTGIQFGTYNMPSGYTPTAITFTGGAAVRPANLTLVPSTLTLNNIANTTISGNTITKTGGTTSVWDSGAYSSQSYTGGCAVRASSDTTSNQMIGLNSDAIPTATYSGIDYAIYLASGAFQVYENGTQVGIYGTYVATDVVEVEYYGSNVYYKKNGVVVRISATTAGRSFYLHYSGFVLNSVLSNIQFGTYQTGDWDKKALSLQSYVDYCAAKFSFPADSTNRIAGLATIDFVANYTYDFSGALLTNTTFAGTVSTNDSGVSTLFTNAAGDQFLRLTSLSYNPYDNYIIKIRAKLTVGSVWEGALYFTNPLHGEAALIRQFIYMPTPTAGAWTDIILDMRNIDSDYVFGGNITQLRFDFVQSIGESCAIDYIQIGYERPDYTLETGFYASSNGSVYPMKDAAIISGAPSTTYIATDVFEVDVSGGIVYYKKNGSVFHYTDIPTGRAYYLKELLYSANSSITSASFGTYPTPAWDTQAISNQFYTNGIIVTFKANNLYSYTMAGLNTDPALNASYTGLDHAFYMVPGGGLYIYESGTQVAGFSSTYTTTDVLEIYYLAGVLKYKKNGVVLRTVSIALNLTFYFDSSFVNGYSGINSVTMKYFTSTTSNLSGSITETNVSTYIGNAAIGAAQIGSLALVGTDNFDVKTALTGARMEMTGRAIKVYDASGVVRIHIGDLSA